MENKKGSIDSYEDNLSDLNNNTGRVTDIQKIIDDDKILKQKENFSAKFLSIIALILTIIIVSLSAILIYFIKYFEIKSNIVTTKRLKVNFLGDSITEGGGSVNQMRDRFSSVVERDLNIKVYNFGVPATKIAKLEDSDFLDFNSRLNDLNKDADLNIIFGGTNDYGWSIPIGEKSSLDNKCFNGALNNLVDGLLKQFNKNQILFILPLPRYNENEKHGGNDLNAYRQEIRNKCEKENIDYLDLSNQIPLPLTDQSSEYFVDGLHPNNLGHKIVANNIIGYINSKFLL